MTIVTPLWSGLAFAQSADGKEVYRQASCVGCHKWHGAGGGGYGGAALSLRETALDRDQLIEMIRSVVDAARDGLGIGWSIRIGVEEDLRSGRLESVLDPYALERPGFSLYFPRASLKLEILRLFVDFIKARPGLSPDSGQVNPAVQIS